MKRQIPGLQRECRNGDEILEGVFLVLVDRAFYRWHPQRPFYVLRFAILEPKEHQSHSLAGRLYCTSKALWKLSWFLRDFGYDPDLMGRDEVDEKALLGLQGVLRTNSGGNSANWSGPRSAKSKPASLLRTAAFASHKTDA